MQRLSPFEPTAKYTIRVPQSIREGCLKAELNVSQICRDALIAELKKYQEEQAAKQPEKEKIGERA